MRIKVSKDKEYIMRVNPTQGKILTCMNKEQVPLTLSALMETLEMSRSHVISVLQELTHPSLNILIKLQSRDTI